MNLIYTRPGRANDCVNRVPKRLFARLCGGGACRWAPPSSVLICGHRRAARRSCAISRPLAVRHEGRQESDLQRRVESLRGWRRISPGSKANGPVRGRPSGRPCPFGPPLGARAPVGCDPAQPASPAPRTDTIPIPPFAIRFPPVARWRAAAQSRRRLPRKEAN